MADHDEASICGTGLFDPTKLASHFAFGKCSFLSTEIVNQYEILHGRVRVQLL